MQTDLATIDPAAIGASPHEVRRLVDRLAAAHDLTLAEAAETIADWQNGLPRPGPSGFSPAA